MLGSWRLDELDEFIRLNPNWETERPEYMFEKLALDLMKGKSMSLSELNNRIQQVNISYPLGGLP